MSLPALLTALATVLIAAIVLLLVLLPVAQRAGRRRTASASRESHLPAPIRAAAGKEQTS